MNNLFSDEVLDALVVEINSGRSISRPKDALSEAREFHGWTLNKLEVFDLYLKLYRIVAGNGTCIDAFAGTGRGLSTGNGETVHVDGSSLIAAKSGAFSNLHLIERDNASFQLLNIEIMSLKPSQQSKIQTYNDDCNLKIPDLLQGGKLDPSKPCFAFLDQESTQLDWATIEALAGWKTYEPPPTERGRPKACKTELWILFNTYQAITRLWPTDRQKYPEAFSPQTLDRIFGGREVWWDLWQDERSFSALVERYCDRLYEIGYQYVLPQLIRDPGTGRPQYHMIHATDHPSAISFMRWAKRSSDGYENQQLLGMETST
ncbi:three-Cys-motif partner protein TcmP [Candidatus Poriferisocius sp.]|uniref:three-Cys-motif partner protein TcmP n=1 Tax=Candidatus Poriferisocius sp. TaxID=3101276 RepID=UPI003B597621